MSRSGSGGAGKGGRRPAPKRSGGRADRSASSGRADRSASGRSTGRGASSRGTGRSGTGRSGTGRSGTGRSGTDTGSSRTGGRRTNDRGSSTRQVGRTTAPRERGLGGTQVEGRQAVRELLLAGRRTAYEILLSTELDHSDVIGDIVDLADELRVPVTEVSRTRLDSLARTDAPQGVVARAGELPDVELESLIRPPAKRGDDGATPPFLLAVDGVTDPGNLGALLRIAECAGVTGVVLPRHRAVHVTPTVTKAAAGAVEYLSMSLVAGLATAVTTMRDAGVWVVGLDAEGDTSIHDLTVADAPVCLVVGAEGPGLSTLVRQRCDVLAAIPLHGNLASLNVASAGAIACYEVARRRS